MPFCASCGSAVEGKFCPKCGSPIAAPAGAGAAGPSPIATPMQDNVASALCYALWIVTGVIFLVMEPYSKNRTVRFHAFQSIFLSAALFIIYEAILMLFPAMFWNYGLFSFYGLYQLFRLGTFVLWIWMMVSAYQGKTVVLPIIGPIAQKQAQS